ncbi:MAG: HNH endonuclease [Reyranella sp.]|nr:HNH endonuclease [Reyranella sp.]
MARVQTFGEVLQKPKKLGEFKAFLTARGAEVLVETNQYEVVRFRVGGTVHILYRSARGMYRPVGDQMLPAFQSFCNGGHWKPVGRKKRSDGQKRTVLIRTLLERDGDDCFYCGVPLGDDISLEDLCPIAAGGPHVVANLALAHKLCNNQAGHLSVVEKVKLRDQLRGHVR